MALKQLILALPKGDKLTVNLEDSMQIKTLISNLKSQNELDSSKSYIFKTHSNVIIDDNNTLKNYNETEYIIEDQASIATAVFKPVGIKVPPVFHQLGLLVLDGSGSMTAMGPFNTSKAKHVSAAVIELFNRINVSRVKQNFSFACIKFDDSPMLSLSPTSFNHSVLMNQDFDPTKGKGGGTHIFEALSEAQKVAETFLSSAPVGGLPHKVLILLMSDGMCYQPKTSEAVATNIKANPKIQIACAYFGEVGKVDPDAQNLLKEICSDLGNGPAFTTVYDGEALRAFFERSMSQSSGIKFE